MLWKNKTNEILIIIILIIGFVLRFYQFDQLSFTWDELSAWNRLQFNSFSELIELGVKPDGHPAGVQVFLYYWTTLFGDTEWVVKLPFALMGVASIYVFYKIGEIWWNKSVALLASTLMASLQFFVLYSTIARPYISGLFLSLMMVYYWSSYIYKSPKRKYLAGFVLFAAASAYNHHFSLLFAAIVGLSGLFIIKKSQLKEYIAAGILIFILYIPHLPVFLTQLEVGGVGGAGNWLNKPSPNFIWQFLHWSFHFSYWVILLLVFTIILSLFNRTKEIDTKWSKRIILLTWFLLPFLIGYFYSIFINPVLQYSLLIFSFPYLLLLILSELKPIKPIILTSLVVAILIVNIGTLVFSRQHYTIIKKQPFNTTAQNIISHKDIPSKDIFLIHNYIENYQNYYLKKNNIDLHNSISIYNKDYSISQFDSLLNTIDHEYVLLSGLPEKFIPVAYYHFPFLIQRTNGYTFESYLLNRKKNKNIPLHHLINKNNFETINDCWNVPENRIIQDSLGDKYFQFLPHQEWGFNMTDSLHLKVNEYGNILDMEVDIISENEPISAMWVCTFSINGKDEIWRGQTTKNNLIKTETGYKFIFSLDTRLFIDPIDYKNTILKTYMWNKSKETFNIKEIKFYNRAVNYNKYGLFSPIRK